MEFLSVISKGTTMDKLSWAFTFYDVDNDGVISKEEMLKVTILGSMFMITVFGDFAQFLAKNMAYFVKFNAMIQFLHKLAVF
jgi:hypothetical protein